MLKVQNSARNSSLSHNAMSDENAIPCAFLLCMTEFLSRVSISSYTYVCTYVPYMYVCQLLTQMHFCECSRMCVWVHSHSHSPARRLLILKNFLKTHQEILVLVWMYSHVCIYEYVPRVYVSVYKWNVHKTFHQKFCAQTKKTKRIKAHTHTHAHSHI